MIKQTAKYASLFSIGGVLYYFIEIICRGFSHWTMILVGGICFILIGLINETILTRNMPLIEQMLISCMMITGVEFIAGVILNRILNLNIWDYSDRPFNILGQICLKNSIYWFWLSLVGIVLDDYIRYLFFHGRKPNYRLFIT